MIRHRPAGSGHPYEADDEQRVPVLPIAGEPIEIRASSHASLTAAYLELDPGRRVPLTDAGLAPNGAGAGAPALSVRRWRTPFDTA